MSFIPLMTVHFFVLCYQLWAVSGVAMCDSPILIVLRNGRKLDIGRVYKFENV